MAPSSSSAIKALTLGLGSERATERQKAVAEIRLCLSDNAALFHNLTASAWTLLIDKFSAFVLKEKDTCLTKQEGSKTASTVTTAETKLSQYGKDFEQICDIGLSLDSHAFDTSARTALEHALEGLWTKAGAPYKPLSTYVRIIRKILMIKKHRDHIKGSVWSAILDLAMFVIKDNDMDEDSKGAFKTSWSNARKSSEYAFERNELLRSLPYLCSVGLREVESSAVEILQALNAFLTKNSLETPCHIPAIATYTHLVLEYFPDFSSDIMACVYTIMPTLIRLFESSQLKDSRTIPPIKTNIIYLFRFYLQTTLLQMETQDSIDSNHGVLVAQIFDAVQQEIKKSKVTLVPSMELLVYLMQSVQVNSFQSTLPIDQCLSQNYPMLNVTPVDLYALSFIDVYCDIVIHKLLLEEFKPENENADRDSEPMSRKRRRHVDITGALIEALKGTEHERDSTFAAIIMAIVKHSRRLHKNQFTPIVDALYDNPMNTPMTEWGILTLATCIELGFAKECQFWEGLAKHLCKIYSAGHSDSTLFFIAKLARAGFLASDLMKDYAAEILHQLVFNTPKAQFSILPLIFVSDIYATWPDISFFSSKEGKVVKPTNTIDWILQSLSTDLFSRIVSGHGVCPSPKLAAQTIAAVLCHCKYELSVDTCTIDDVQLSDSSILEYRYIRMQEHAFKVLACAFDSKDFKPATKHSKSEIREASSELLSQVKSLIVKHLSHTQADYMQKQDVNDMRRLYLTNVFIDIQASVMNSMDVKDSLGDLTNYIKSTTSARSKCLKYTLALLKSTMLSLKTLEGQCSEPFDKYYLEVAQCCQTLFDSLASNLGGPILKTESKAKDIVVRDEFDSIKVNDKNSIGDVFSSAIHLDTTWGSAGSVDTLSELRLVCALLQSVSGHRDIRGQLSPMPHWIIEISTITVEIFTKILSVDYQHFDFLAPNVVNAFKDVPLSKGLACYVASLLVRKLFELLSDSYNHEKDRNVWRVVLQTLASIAKAVVRYPDADDLKRLVVHILAFFTEQLRGSGSKYLPSTLAIDLGTAEALLKEHFSSIMTHVLELYTSGKGESAESSINTLTKALGGDAVFSNLMSRKLDKIIIGLLLKCSDWRIHAFDFKKDDMYVRDIIKQLKPLLLKLAEVLVMSKGVIDERQASSIVKFTAILLKNPISSVSAKVNEPTIETMFFMRTQISKFSLYKDMTNILLHQYLDKNSYSFAAMPDIPTLNAELLGFMMNSNISTEEITLDYLLRFLTESQPADHFITNEVIPFVVSCLSRVSEALHVKALKCLAKVITSIPAKHHPKIANSDEYLDMLQKLKLYCGDDDIKIAGASIRAVKCILSTEEGQLAFTKLDQHSQEFLAIFRPKTVSDHGVLYPPTLSEYPQLEAEDLWISEGKSFDEWIIQLSNTIIKHCELPPLYKALGCVVELLPQIGVDVLPHIFYYALAAEQHTSSSRVRDLFSKGIKAMLTSASATSAKPMSCIISVLEFLRGKERPDSQTAFDHNFWLEVDFFKASHAALKIKNYHAALLFWEIWASTTGADTRSQEALNLLMNIEKMCDYDGFQGVTALLEPSKEHMLMQYEQERMWMRSLNANEACLLSRQLSANPLAQREAIYGLSQSLLGLGLNHVLTQYFGSGIQPDSEIADIQFEGLWRCGVWDDVGYDKANLSTVPHNYFVYESLRAAHKGSFSAAEGAVYDGYARIAELLNNQQPSDIFNDENTNRIVSLTDISEAVRTVQDFDNGRMQYTVAQWDNGLESLLKSRTFDDVEYIGACRIKAMELIVAREQQSLGLLPKPPMTQYFRKFLLSYSKLARKSNNLHKSQYAIEMVKGYSQDTADFGIVVEELKILWSEGNHTSAIRRLKGILGSLGTNNESNNCQDHAKLSCLLAKWTDINRSENPKGIMDLFKAAAFSATLAINPIKGDLLAEKELSVSKLELADSMGGCFYHLAQFSDKCYQNMLADDTHTTMVELLREKERELAEVSRELKKQAKNEAKISIRRLSAEIKVDKMEIAHYEKNLNDFLMTSIKNYARCLEVTDRWNLSVFRLCSLWFSNATSTAINEEMLKSTIPSRKFIGLIYQLSARMSMDNDAFQHALKRIISIMIKEHPLHVLYQLIALKNGAQDKDGKPLTFVPSVNQAAIDILAQIRANSNYFNVVELMDTLADAYIELTRLQQTGQGRGAERVTIDRRLKFARIKDLNTPVITVDIPVDKTRQYRNVPTIQSVSKEYKLVGGINAPKVISCLGSDGVTYQQLVKGGSDDLRQDAVLSNIFSMVNLLLNKSVETRKRNLSIRTYKVVPLGNRVGVLEWVNDTITLGDYLLKAHLRYGKNEMSPIDARKVMMKEHEREGSDPQAKYEVYQTIAKSLSPVLRHFFFEQFTDPATWFEKRLAYTRSTAVNSIVGWIVGLGDRHLQNALIDRRTGEVIQIDLGIAFDTGRILSTPEVVPFRLTRDIVDGMGSKGVEGPYRRSCEETLKVVRSNSHMLLTILEVFRYDPLYQWKAPQTRSKELKETVEATKGSQISHNNHAERALIGVRRKLSETLSVECHINELILTASDPRNLCRMYPGWQPWI
ncbi:hypothetical protein HDV05_001335 [Chytridiales sp. JEL 0842]|nr:hypothetical protein HDV05_001335 [Chytridiales sp. JEL 0842]